MNQRALPVELQQEFWNSWNARTREESLDEISWRQAEVVTGWLTAIGQRDLDIIDVGCGAGWTCSKLVAFGKVTGTDLADEVLARAADRLPQARFIAGDFMALDLPPASFDVVVCLEVLSHVADQPAFLDRVAALLRPGGLLMMATQNRPVLERSGVSPPGPGQIRQWVDRKELRALLAPRFDTLELFSVTPRGGRGLLRLLNSRQVNRAISSLAGRRFERLKESLGLGWTIMALARRRPLPRT